MRCTSTKGVLPMASTMSADRPWRTGTFRSRTPHFLVGFLVPTAPSPGDGGKDRDDVPFLDFRVEKLEESDILIVPVNVHEPVKLLAIQQPVPKARMGFVQVLEDIPDRHPLNNDRLGSPGVPAEDLRNPNLNAHCSPCISGRSAGTP